MGSNIYQVHIHFDFKGQMNNAITGYVAPDYASVGSTENRLAESLFINASGTSSPAADLYVAQLVRSLRGKGGRAFIFLTKTLRLCRFPRQKEER